MSKYKKLVIGIPIACILFTSPTYSFAATNSKTTPKASTSQKKVPFKTKVQMDLNFR
ncbi:hypothetical protein [Baia soyae]|uniref:Uncharacterized protein n=1 Tax=Baia soyae TaxID=1544746 RepID=A0A4R2RJM9_9BACL|nr:hypothetical protein [Baia soyae]TCP62729.1 hypothetical protein EDD57_15110 [Baia soyae]